MQAKRLQSYYIFLIHARVWTIFLLENPENPDRYANPAAGFVMQVSWRLSAYVVLILC